MTDNLEIEIENWVKENPNHKFILDIERLPNEVKDLLEALYPDEEYKEWLTTKNKVYFRKTPLQVLSELDSIQLRQTSDKLWDGLARVFSFVSVDYFPTKDEFYSSIRKAQYEQIKEVTEAQK